MYHLLSGLYQQLTRKDEYNVLILGLDNAGKTTLLEKIKTLYNPTPGLPPDKIAPTVGQNMGKITLPSTILQFWDLGGQRDIRLIWPRYYDDCHAVAYVVDAADRERLEEGWEVFENVLSAPQILGVPLILLANKQDVPDSMTVEEIRNHYEEWFQRRQREHAAEMGPVSPTSEVPTAERMASLNVQGISAIEGTGVRDAVNWLFIRVQNSRQRSDH
ncbi:P-loop containing nucleoside triphosphate hydrolase protein [Calocera cornea HHB12733]|uniref:p-loop containing nucleoside triphosphate hydrolase protein n=1 Tax=Calocera cornea HHB12733 TaxID=1353952 RepID=A0A165DIE4_9BASI|nr:P-loop containing nucleoside triphosphate hydrolase protein [Calocera cornea HHB12733]